MAGGLNLYGFAGGDPINFSDPFGLCPGCGGLLAPLTGRLSAEIGRPPLQMGVFPDVGPRSGLKLAQSAGTVARHAAKYLNALNALDERHLEIAVRELRGAETGWDHVTEGRSNMQAMRKTIRAMDGLLEGRDMPDWLRSGARLLRDRADDALARAEKALASPP